MFGPLVFRPEWRERIAVGPSAAYDRAWTYDQLWHLSHSIAFQLDGNGPVYILGQRSALAYAALLACWTTGHAFVPLNPKWPASRMKKVIDAAGAGKLLYENRYAHLLSQLGGIQSECLDRIQIQAQTAPVAVLVDDARAAYILFTSGSTGEPKGIVVSRKSVKAWLSAIQATLPIVPEDRLTQGYDLSFDLGVGEIIWSVSQGASLWPLEPGELALLDRYLGRARPTIWASTPSMVQLLSAQGFLSSEPAATVRRSLFCGERLLAQVCQAWARKAPNAEIINLYGPTEATVHALWHRWHESDPGEAVAIGRALPGVRVRIVGVDAKPVAVGAIGELVLGGDQVENRYLTGNQDGFSEDRFGRWYATGDLVREGREGWIEFVGRRDHQVKIGGYRIELGEVEVAADSVLRGRPAAALATSDENGMAKLVFVVSGNLTPKLKRDLERRFAQVLPSYARPTSILQAESWPLNEHGKLDREKLGRLIQR